MPKPVMPDFTRDHVFRDDGSLEFNCNHDLSIWPWLALHPHDVTVVQTINYWAPVETGRTKGTFSGDKWTALTETEWQCGDRDIGHAVRGVAAPVNEDDSLGYNINFYDVNDAFVYKMKGAGVVFQTRDFEGWRANAKERLGAQTANDEFGYAPAELVGADHQSHSFISPLISGNQPSAAGLITKENGLTPNHPHISGSGDHVNSTHLAVIAMQFASLVNQGARLHCTGGQMSFERFVELGHPIEMVQTSEAPAHQSISLKISQAGRSCAQVSLDYQFIAS